MTIKKFDINTDSRTFEGVPVHKIPWPRVQPLGFATIGHIFLRDALWEDYLTGGPKPKTLSVLAHEYTHIQRLGKRLKPHIVFWLRRDYRFQEELAAIQNKMSVLKQYGEDFDIDKRARHLSGVAYLWCTDYKTATKERSVLWHN